MSIAAAIALLRRFGPIMLIATAIAAALVYRAQRDNARGTLAIERIESAAALANQARGFAERQASATSAFAAQLAAREPIIVHSTNTVREYAQTDAGRARCLGADRVRGLDAYLSALAGADPAPAGRSAEAVRAQPDPAPAGR